MKMFENLLVLGAGTAGFLAALSVKKKLPQVAVRVVRSPEIGTIGVGESTTPNILAFLFDYLGISRQQFYELAEPIWKLGIHFLWGPRESFEYSFLQQMDVRILDFPRPMGYYCNEDFTAITAHSAIMSSGKAFPRRGGSAGPDIHDGHAFHLENAKFVKLLERIAIDRGIEIIDGKMSEAVRGPQGIRSITLEDGRQLTADFFIDASGFRSELLGKALHEPYISYSNSLFNDRALLSSWARRPDEPILPYTTAETMDAGWAWRIDHEHIINRGYVYSSAHISDDQARAELARKNPRAIVSDRVVRFRSGRHQRGWVDNVMAIGNSFGFVEPLEATALMLVFSQCRTFVDLVQYIGPTPGVRDLFNRLYNLNWEEIRDFLALHFKLNTRLDTPYWKHCRAETDISGSADLLAFYQENGPTGFARYQLKNPAEQFGIEGFLVMFVGNKVPYLNMHTPTAQEATRLSKLRAQNRWQAQSAMTAEQCLACIRHPAWQWFEAKQAAQ